MRRSIFDHARPALTPVSTIILKTCTNDEMGFSRQGFQNCRKDFADRYKAVEKTP
jgi:hypothetical protein